MAGGRSQARGALPSLVGVALVMAGALAASAAVVVILGVIPDVRDIWVPRTAGAGASVPAFWASVFANLVFACVMLGTVAGRRLQSRRWRWLVLILGAGAIVQALMYLDASSAFNGPLEAAMQPTRDQLRRSLVS